MANRAGIEIKFNKLFINNEWTESERGKTFAVVNASTEEEIGQVIDAEKTDVDKAVAAAQTAFHHESQWRTMDASERGRLIFRLADLIEDNLEELLKLNMLEAGKLKQYVKPEIEECYDLLRYLAGWADKNSGKCVPSDGKLLYFTRHEPIGVCGIITPSNFPMDTMILSLGAALATGNVIILKPSELTPFAALYVAELTRLAGFPPGVVNVVTGRGSQAGHLLSSHPGVDKVTVTGTSKTGTLVRVAAATSNHKRVHCQLGGKSPLVVFDDCPDLTEAVLTAHNGCFYNNGQICVASSRIFVHENIYDEFVQMSKKLAEQIVVGDPFDMNVTQGPQRTEERLNSILKYIDIGKREGAKLECGGQRIGRKGFFVEPTVFSNVTNDMIIAREEIFGPVMSILKFSTLDEVIQMANDNDYGLYAGIFSKDMNKCMKFTQAVRSGVVYINDYISGGIQVSHGGCKASGYGRDMGEYSLYEFTNVKSVCMKLLYKCS